MWNHTIFGTNGQRKNQKIGQKQWPFNLCFLTFSTFSQICFEFSMSPCQSRSKFWATHRRHSDHATNKCNKKVDFPRKFLSLPHCFLAGSINLRKIFTTLLAITRLLDFWVHYPTLPYPKLKNHYSSGPAYPPAQCQYMNNRHIQISSTIVPNYYQSLANLPLLGQSAKPMPILGKSDNLIKPISHTRTRQMCR